MSIQTRTIWNWPVDDATASAIRAEMPLHLGKQVQLMEQVEGPEPNQMTVQRWWADEESANTWLAFVAQYNPVSSGIVR